MAQSARLRRRHGKSSSDQGKESKTGSSQSNQPSRATKKRKNKCEEEETAGEAAGELEELFKVEKIVDSKLDKNSVLLYKTRWHGYTAADDTWEPAENVASTGHVDRYERQQRQKTLKKSSAGVAVIEYEDGEREMVNMKLEKFRGYRPDSSDDERDDDTVDGDDDVNDFKLLEEGQWIEMLWRHTNMYFPCKIISWTPLRPKRSHKKGAGNPSRKSVLEDVEESPGVPAKQSHLKRTSKRLKQGADTTNRDKRQQVESVISQPKPALAIPSESAKVSLPEPAPEQMQQIVRRRDSEPTKTVHETGEDEDEDEEGHNDFDNHSINNESSGLRDDIDSDSLSDRPVERVGHGVPLFDEPEDDFDSSDDDDSDDNGEGEGISAGQYPCHHEAPKLSFEELWTLKLKRTQEMMEMDASVSNGHN